MAWNEPSNNGDGNKPNNQDPWKRNRNSQSDDLNFDVSKWIKKLFGGKSGPSNSNKNGLGFLAIIAIILCFVMSTGFYTLTEAERAVVLRFGNFDRIETSGLHWRIPLVEQINVLDVNLVRVTQNTGSMLTKDENVVDVEITVQYNISDPKEYLFNVAEPDSSLNQAIDSALRYVVGHTSMDEVLTNGISQVRISTKELLESIIDKYHMGITINNVVFKAKAPDDVKAAFDDAISAQEDEQRFKSEANAYANEVLPKADGQAQRILQEAEAYKQGVVMKAKGEIARFEKILPQYLLAPEITKRRIFLETMENVYASNPKIIVNVKQGGNSVLYMPLDKMIDNFKQNDVSLKKVQ
jgi:modulator of FtsH protease HflK